VSRQIDQILHDLSGCVDALRSSLNIQSRLSPGETVEIEDDRDVKEALEIFAKNWQRLKELRIEEENQ